MKYPRSNSSNLNDDICDAISDSKSKITKLKTELAKEA